MSIYSTEQIRSRFPALERRHNGSAVAYFDGPGGTQVPGVVTDAMADYLLHHNANAHWAYPTSAETDGVILDARTAAAAFLNARPEQIAFGANMTTLAFHLSRALAREIEEGDEIIVTELDHHANVAPWARLEMERGAVLKVARMDTASGTLDWSHFEACVGPRTRLIAMGAASNALGTISDVGRASSLARRAGARLFVDAVHYAPHELVDVQVWNCDFLACSSYKFYGPHVGILYGKDLGSLDFARLRPAPDDPPERAETGTLNHEGLAGTTAAIHFLASLADPSVDDLRLALARSFDGLHDRSRDLTARLWHGLAGTEGVTLYGPGPDAERTPTVAFTVEGLAAQDVAAHLAMHGVFVSHGDFYAQTVVERLGVEGLVRAGCACYTSTDDVDRLVAAVAELSSESVSVRR